MKPLLLVSVAAILILASVGCSDKDANDVTSPPTERGGMSFLMSLAPANQLGLSVAKVTADMTHLTTAETVSIDLLIDTDSLTAEASVSDMRIGEWEVIVSAYNSGDTLFASGGDTVTVNPGEVASASIHLRITGGIDIDVTWDGLVGTVTDIDGNVYQTIKIDDQWWMAENLKVTHYRNGDPIPIVTETSEWGNLSTGAYCEHNNDPFVVDTYGRLYNWFAVNDTRGIAPEGWHVPTDNDWKQLEMYLGMSQSEADGYLFHGTDEGDKLKETGTAHWLPPNSGATDEVGFTALPGAERGRDGAFSALGTNAYFWASDETNTTEAWSRHLFYTRSDIYRYDYVKVNGFSVRCVKD